MHLKMKLESFKDNYLMFVGVAKADVVPPNNDSRQRSGSYGWVLGQYGQVWKDGSCTNDNALQNITKQGGSTISHRNTQVTNLETSCKFVWCK